MDFSFEEITLGLFELESCFIQFSEDDFNVFEMLLLISAENNDVIKIHHREFTTVVQSNRDQLLKVGACASPKGTTLNSYLLNGVTNAVLALDLLSNEMW